MKGNGTGPGKGTRFNVVLVGMPGAGKSTVGVILAKTTTRGFIDSDVLIQALRETSLQQIVDSGGHLRLRGIEEQVLLNLRVENRVIATGGSAVYSAAAMRHLKSGGIVVFLDVDLATLESRVSDIATRGLARRPGQSLADLYRERLPLYREHADVTIDCSGLCQEEVCAAIVRELRARGIE